jgi:hypothetical protein
MKYIHKLVRWFKRKFFLNFSHKFKFDFVEDIPKQIPESKVLVVADGNQPDTLVFKCPCGCFSDIHLNLLIDAKPCWKYKITDSGKITITPSIWRKIGCRSHFFITEGKVIWV